MKLTIWNKTIQSLLLSKNEGSIQLALKLVHDVEEVMCWRYLNVSYRVFDLPKELDEKTSSIILHSVMSRKERVPAKAGLELEYLKQAYENYLNSLE